MRIADEKLSRLKHFLIDSGAKKQKHSGRSLFDHLEGVHRILFMAGSEEAVCTAGLFHSVYGTLVYRQSLLDLSVRTRVQALIGLRSEEIVWAFRSLPRPKIFESSLITNNNSWLEQNVKCVHSSTEQLWVDLLAVECANILEQKSMGSFPALAHHAQKIGMVDAEGFCI